MRGKLIAECFTNVWPGAYYGLIRSRHLHISGQKMYGCGWGAYYGLIRSRQVGVIGE
jgi:hypothetical protein